MEFTIGKKKYPLEFGFDFISRLNKRNGLIRDDINFRGALPSTMPSLFMRDIETVVDYIICANKDLFKEPSLVIKKIEKLSYEENDQELEDLTDDLLDAVREGAMTRSPFKKLEKEVKKNQEKVNK